jgi:hypothetical protein
MLTTHAQLDMFSRPVERASHADEEHVPLTFREKMAWTVSLLCLSIAVCEVIMTVYLLRM